MKLTLKIANADELLAETDRVRVWVGRGGKIGRSEDNDWVLPDPRSEISRSHARIHIDSSTYYIEDLSTNGVFLNNREKRIGISSREISNGDTIFIGHYQIDVLIEEECVAVSRASVIVPDFEDKDSLELVEPVSYQNNKLSSVSTHSLSEIDDAVSLDQGLNLTSAFKPPKIPEDWSFGSFSVNHEKENISSHNASDPNLMPKALTDVAVIESISVLQKEALIHSLESLLNKFDPVYVEAVLSKVEGGKTKVFDNIYEKKFLPYFDSFKKEIKDS